MFASGRIAALLARRKKAPLKLLVEALHRHENGELGVLDYLQRLNFAGIDVKGQISSAYAQSGYGLAAGFSIDIGYLLCPCVTLSISADLGHSRTAHGVLVLHRLSSRAWGKDIVQPEQPPRAAPYIPMPPPDWISRKPIALALLEGQTWELSGSKAFTAAIGVGEVGNYDEFGLAVGVKWSDSASAICTRLADPNPDHYVPTVDNRKLNDDLIELFEDRLKKKAAAWLLEMGGRMKDLTTLGQPRIPLAERLTPSQVARALREGFGPVIGAYDQTVSYNNVSASSMSEPVAVLLHGLAAIADKVFAKWSTLKTQELLQQLKDVKQKIETWKADLEADRLQKVFERQGLISGAQRRIDEAEELIEALEDRAVRAKPAPAASSGVTQRPAFYLDITTTTFRGALVAQAKLVFLPLQAGLMCEGSVSSRSTSFAYQSYVKGATGAILTSTQETIVEYRSRKLEWDNRFAKWQKAGTKEAYLVTMTYQSVIVHWLEALQAMPNGSGVSFGMSVVAPNLASYVRACQDPSAQQFTKDILTVEQAIMRQLRVTQPELRQFARNAPPDLDQLQTEYDPVSEAFSLEPFLLESAFAIKEPIDLQGSLTKEGYLTGLRNLDDFKMLFQVGNAINSPADRGTNVRLQVIRLRYRIRNDEDMSSNMVKLGATYYAFNTDTDYTLKTALDPSKFDDPTNQPFAASGPSPVSWTSLGIGLSLIPERVRRVGTEGIIDLYLWVFPRPYDESTYGPKRAMDLELQAERNHDITDILVPPAVLFNQ